MIQYKPILLPMLVSALPYGLSIYGSYWDLVPEVSRAWKGVLPREDIAIAYANAQVVLATTIETQSSLNMINNRVFEALACGAVVVSDHSDALEETFKDLVYLIKDASEVSPIISKILANPEEAAKRRIKARKEILRYHTWEHRAIEITDFFTRLKVAKIAKNSKCDRNTCRRLAFVVSDHLKTHPDYLLSGRHCLAYLEKLYDVDTMDASTWIVHSSRNITCTVLHVRV